MPLILGLSRVSKLFRQSINNYTVLLLPKIRRVFLFSYEPFVLVFISAPFRVNVAGALPPPCGDPYSAHKTEPSTLSFFFPFSLLGDSTNFQKGQKTRKRKYLWANAHTRFLRKPRAIFSQKIGKIHISSAGSPTLPSCVNIFREVRVYRNV